MEHTEDTQDITDLYRRDPRRGFDRLYRDLAGRLTTYLRRAFTLGDEEIADVVHDAFLPWVETPEKMAGVRNPRSYLFSTARYLAIQKKRAAARTVTDEALETLSHPCPTGGVESGLDIRAALQGLPEEQREAVTLKIWGDLTFEEIAEIQEVALQTVASRYRYGLQKLEEKLAWTE